MESSLNIDALQQELRAAQEAVRAAPDARTRALLHRDAAYTAMHLGEFSLAMTHAVTSLDIARGTGDRPLQAKAHVTIALVMLTIRPNFLACMPGRTARISIRAGSMLALIAESQAASSQLAK